MAIIVADAGPLIALSKTGRLALLAELFQEVRIPETVVSELKLERPRPGVEALNQAFYRDKWIQVLPPTTHPALGGLDEGEAAAIILAEESDCMLLIDERRGRKAAVARGITVIGTGRVLIAAKSRGLIASVKDELDALQDCGYRLSSPLYKRLIELAEESNS